MKNALHEIDLSGMTVIEVKGFGRQRGQEGIDKNQDKDYDVEFHAKVKIEIIVEDDIVEKAIESIIKAAFSGKIGDGKIFVSNIEQVMRIRTGEKGSEAV